MSDGQEEKRGSEKIKNWLKDRNNLAFLAILIFGIAIRLYYFSLTKTQPLWWDEADYMAYAKNLAGLSTDWIISPRHNSLYPFLAAALLKINFSEQIIKFIVQILPSTITVALTYFIASEMYKDKRIALISSFLMAVFWIHLFNTFRFHVDIPGLFAGFMAFYIFWKGYENKEKIFGKIKYQWAIPLSVFFVILAYTIRRGYAIFGGFFLVYMLLTRNWRDLAKDKYNWIGLAIAILMFFAAEQIIFSSAIVDVSGDYYHSERPINFLPLGVFSQFLVSPLAPLSSLFLYLFWLGSVLMLAKLFLSFGFIKKKKESRADLFNLITLFITIGFFIFVLRTPASLGEARWYLPLSLATFVTIARSSTFLIDYIRPYNKKAAVIILVALFAFAGYSQLQSSDAVIKSRVNSFEGTRQAGLLLQEVSQPGDLIITRALPQTAYYSERSVVQPTVLTGWEGTKEEVPFNLTMEKIVETPEAKYLMVSFSEPGHPTWMKLVHQSQGQVIGWEIPFMQTKIDFTNQNQDIKSEIVYNDYNIKFKLLEIKQDVFVYEIERI